VPIDQWHSPQGLLTNSAKAEIAEEITGIHCTATGAPPSFVNVPKLG
jgi:phenylpyruvate tautomerase PptA (4-oxalocrotonate tautomerase family)